MQTIQQQVLERLDALTLEQQQQVLDFVEFLQAKRQGIQTSNEETESAISFLEAARDYIGRGEGPGDLSTNPKYMEGYGT